MTHPEHFGASRFNLTHCKWQYRGEGNANIVISFPEEKKVLRLPKSSKSISDLDTCCRLQVNMTFISSIMRPLLGPIFVSCPSLVYLTHEDIDYLNKTLLPLRPRNRRHKELSFSGGELCDDHAFLPPEISALCSSETLSIELKPKQGVFPPEMRHKVCAFCCKQEWKLSEGQVSNRSRYCPLDLFSGQQSRMEHSVKSLLCTPQNNLRVFCNGDLLYGEGMDISSLQKVLNEWFLTKSGTDTTARFVSLLLQALTSEFDSTLFNDSSETWKYEGVSQFNGKFQEGLKMKGESTPSISLSPCNYEKQDLPKNCILHRLAEAQALDVWGNNFVHHLLMDDKSSSKNDLDPSNSTFANFNYVSNIIKKGSSSKLNPIELYLIAAAVRDCSVLVSFQMLRDNIDHTRLNQMPHIVDDVSKRIFLFKIAVVDVDPKPLSCIVSHKERDTAITKILTGDVKMYKEHTK